MFLYGYGTKSRQKKVSDNEVVVNNFRYVTIMFISWVTWAYQYQLSTLHEDGWHSKVITKQEALAKTGGDELMPNLWMRYSLLAVLVSSAITIVGVLLGRML